MTSVSRLNKPLWTNLTRLKLMDHEKRKIRFIIEKNPFDDFEDDEIPEEKDEYFITGRVYPDSGVYKDIGFGIEMKLTINYPREVPIVRITSPIYHPNIEPDGTFCHQMLNNVTKWRNGATLEDVINTLVKYLDEPEPLYAVNLEIAQEFMTNNEEYKRKARELAEKSVQKS